MKQKGLKVWIAVITGILALSISGCDSDDGGSNTASLSTPSVTTPATPNSSSNDASEIQALNIGSGADNHGLIRLYGTLSSFSALPVNFQVTGYSNGGSYFSVPTGESNLDGFPGDHMEARRFIVMAIKGNAILKVEDGSGTWNSHIGEYYAHSDKILAIHLKHGQAVSRTKLTAKSEI